MTSSKLSFKFFLEDSAEIELAELVPVFHSWIQTHAIPDHLLIDVADYAHVHNGPGIVLVAHEGNFSFDRQGGRLGLTYQRKQPLNGSLAQRIGATLRYTLQAAALLEQAPPLGGRIKFGTEEARFRIHDRLLGPNNAQTFEAVKSDLQKVFSEVWGGDVAIEHSSASSPLELFEATVKSRQSPGVGKLLERGAAAMAI